MDEVTEPQRKKVMALLQGVLAWQNADVDEQNEAHDLLLYSVDDMDSETIAELVRIVNGGANLKAV
jgi:hypothetical protein